MNPPSTTTAAQFLINWVHLITVTAGALLVIYSGMIYSLAQAGVDVHPNPIAAGIGAGLVSVSQALSTFYGRAQVQSNAAVTAATVSAVIPTELQLPDPAAQTAQPAAPPAAAAA